MTEVTHIVAVTFHADEIFHEVAHAFEPADHASLWSFLRDAFPNGITSRISLTLTATTIH